MPSPRHDALIKLLQCHPELPIRFLREVGGVGLPLTPHLTVGPGDLRDRISREMHADTVVFAGPPQERWYSDMVEVETQMTEAALQRIATKANALWLETRKAVYITVFTPDPEAGKFAEPVKVEEGGLSLTMRPVIVGPDQIPILIDPQKMLGDLLMAVLSVMAHGHRSEVALAFVDALKRLAPEDAEYIYGYTIDMAAPSVRPILEDTVTTYVPEHSGWYRRVIAEGKAEGAAEARAQDVLRIADRRDLELSAQQRDRITGSMDLVELDRWFDNALSAETADGIFS